MSLLLQQGRQPGGQRVHIGNQQQHHDADEQQGHQCLQGLAEAGLADLVAQQQAQAHRRRDQADAQVEAHDDAEHQGVDAVQGQQGHQDGGHHNDGGIGLHEHTDDEEQQVQQQQDQHPALSEAGEGVQQQGRQAGGDHHIAGGLGQAHHHHDGGGGNGCLHKGCRQLAPLGILTDKQAHDQGVHHGHGSGLGGGEDTAEDTAQNDNGHQQRPDAALEGLGHLLGRHLLVGGEVIALSIYQGVAHEAHHQQQAGDHRADKQLGHRHIGDGGVHDQGNRRRNDGAQNGRNGRHGHGEGSGIAFLLHGGNGQAANGGGRGHTGAGDGAEQAGGHHRYQGQAALDAPDEGVGHINELPCYTAGHEVARQDEEGNGQQGGGVHTGKEFLGQHQHGQVRHVQGYQGADAQGDKDGNAQEGQKQQQNKYEQCCVHTAVPPFFSSASS